MKRPCVCLVLWLYHIQNALFTVSFTCVQGPLSLKRHINTIGWSAQRCSRSLSSLYLKHPHDTAGSDKLINNHPHSVGLTSNDFTSYLPPTRRRQRNPSARPRKPKYYWTDLDNLYRELQGLWKEEAGITYQASHNSSSSTPNTLQVLVPNETLLRYLGRHDVRAAIASHGGRVRLENEYSHLFRIQSGRWTEGVTQESMHMSALLQKHSNLSAKRPPFLGNAMSSALTTNTSASLPIGNTSLNKQVQLPKNQKRLKGYWTSQKVIEEL
jgi:hypothetical protein